jgi:thiol-disulfide isomerase/thioredoxin
MDPAPQRPRLDRRTITICVAIASVGAALTFVVLLVVLSNRDGSTEATETTASSTGSTTKSTLTAVTRAPVDTKVTRFDGSPLKLADFRGQKLVVNFFSSTCVPCRKEMPALQAVHERLGEDVTFIGIAVQDDRDAAQDLIDKTGVRYELGQDPSGKLFQDFGGVVLPMTAFVDADGTVMDTHTGALDEQEITQRISDNLLAGG